MRATTALLIESYWADGMSSTDIARRLGVTRGAVTSYIAAHRDRCPRRRPPDLHERMRELWAQGMTVRAIAGILGVSERSVYDRAKRYREDFPYRTRRGQTRQRI